MHHGVLGVCVTSAANKDVNAAIKARLPNTLHVTDKRCDRDRHGVYGGHNVAMLQLLLSLMRNSACRSKSVDFVRPPNGFHFGARAVR